MNNTTNITFMVCPQGVLKIIEKKGTITTTIMCNMQY